MSDVVDNRLREIQRELIDNFLDALAKSERLVSDYPEHFDALMMRAFVRMRARDFAGAQAALTDIAAKFPDRTAVHFNLAVCCDRQNRLADALRHFSQARQHSGSEDLPAVLAARCMHRLGRPDAAIAVLADIVKRSPGHAGARLWLLHALREAGATDASEHQARILQQSLKADRKSLLSLVSFCQENDFAGWARVDDKASLSAEVEQYQSRRGARTYDALPATYTMPDEHAALVAAHAAAPGPWLVKPANLHNGHGIQLITSPAEAPVRTGWIVQRYVEKPALVHERKPSLRVFLLVTSVAPVRVYLFRGGRTVFSVEPYESGNYEADSLPMHIAHTNVFGKRVQAAFEETKRVLNHANAEWPYARLAGYLRDKGMDTDALWRKLRRLAQETVDLLERNGIFAAQAERGNSFAYVPKIVSLDVLIDHEGRPWLTEIETGPTINGLFDGGLEQDETFNTLVDLITTPMPDAAKQNLRGAELNAHQADAEWHTRGQFELLRPLSG